MENLDYEEIKLDDEIGKILKEGILNDFCKKIIKIGKDDTVISELYLQYAEEIRNFEVYDDDVWVMSYPKAGTTWTQEMVWMIANNLDFDGAKKPLKERFPFLEVSGILDRKMIFEKLNMPFEETDVSSVEYAKQVQRPRFIKTHLPFSLLPKQLQDGTKSPKMVCVIRNPKDSCVSFYYHGTLLMGWQASLENFAKVFMSDKTNYGSYWKHLWSYWNKRHLSNLLIIKYEDMKTNLPSVVKTVAKFLNKEMSDEQVQLLCKHTSFESMKSNAAVNFEDYTEKMRQSKLIVKEGAFLRTGTVGKYKEELSAETIAKFNEWIKKNVSGTELENEDIFQV